MISIKPWLLAIYYRLPENIRYLFSCYDDVYKFYCAAQWWKREDIEKWQFNRLKMILDYAYYNTDGYRQLYNEAHISPLDFQKLEDIKYFPFTNKQLIRENLSSFVVSGKIAGRLYSSTTSGSTGVPFHFLSDYRHSMAEHAFMDAAWQAINWNSTQVGIILRGRFLGSDNVLMHKVAFHRYAMASSKITDDNYDEFIHIITNQKADFLHVYPSTISDLSRLIISHNDEGVLRVKSIMVGSEHFYNWQKEIVRKAFPNVKIMHWYGHSERAIFAPWCELNDKFHINPFYGFTEILKDNQIVNEGEIGELIGTSFWMFGTPFIRYSTGDYAEKGKFGCEKCGRNFQLINTIDGRRQDFVIGKSGHLLSLTIFDGFAMHGEVFNHINLFRFVQREIGKLVLYVVPTAKFTDNDKVQLESIIREFFKNDFDVVLKIIENLDKSSSGKFSYLEQHLIINNIHTL